jgi:hypothetical protein
MENKQPNYLKSKTRHSTLLGTLFFTLFNLVLLSTLAWVLLEIWFNVQIILLDSLSSRDDIQKILSTSLSIIKQQPIDIPLNIFPLIKNATYSFLEGYVKNNNIDIFLDVTAVILNRCCLFIAFIPFMVVILCVLIIDGLVLRDKRKFQGARESAFLFHRIKPLAKLSFFSLFFIYMVTPYNIAPSLFLVPMVILSSLFVMLSIKSFKKYL